MATSARINRQKISTTIAPDTLAYLGRLLDSGEVLTLADAIDLAIGRLRTFENRERLATDTAAYFANLTEEEAAEEDRLEAALSQSAGGIDFEQ